MGRLDTVLVAAKGDREVGLVCRRSAGDGTRSRDGGGGIVCRLVCLHVPLSCVEKNNDFNP